MKIIIYVRLYVSFIINVRNYIIIGVTSFNLGCNTILTDSGEFAFIIACKQLLHWHWLLIVGGLVCSWSPGNQFVLDWSINSKFQTRSCPVCLRTCGARGL